MDLTISQFSSVENIIPFGFPVSIWNAFTIFIHTIGWPNILAVAFNLNFPKLLYLRRREDVSNLGNSGKSKMNHMSIYIIRREIQRWFRIWSQKFIFAYAFKRKSRFKKFAWANQKNLMCIESALKFQFEICAYVDTCVISNSRIAHVQKIDFS